MSNKKYFHWILVIIAIVILVAFTWDFSDNNIKKKANNDMIKIVLYFSDEDALNLVKEERSIKLDNTNSLERVVLEELIAGPMKEGNYRTIPDKTKILSVNTDSNKLCTVNLSEDFVKEHWGGSTGEIFTIYSIVNSLCELENVEKVNFLIDGEERDEFKGHIDFSQKFSFKNVS